MRLFEKSLYTKQKRNDTQLSLLISYENELKQVECGISVK